LYLRKLAVLLAMLDAPSSKTLQNSAWQADGATGTLLDAAAVLRPQRIKVPETVPTFDFAKASSIKDPNLLPGSLRFGNTAGLHATAMEMSK
jgi:hypothetical protein